MKILILMAILITVVEASTTIYVPSLPFLAKIFNVNELDISWSLSLNLFATAISGMIYGSFSDCYGRKTPMIIGTNIFAIASILLSFAYNLELFILCRLLQGIGAGVAFSVAFSAVRDIYKGQKEASRAISSLSIFIAVSPALFSIIGGYIVEHFNWKLNFIIVAIASAISSLLIYLFLEETLDKSKYHAWSIKYFMKSYYQLFKNQRFFFYLFIHIIQVTWLWTEIAIFPFLFIETMNITIEEFSYLYVFIIFVYIIGQFINRFLVKYLELETLVLIGISLVSVTNILLFIGYYYIELTPYIIRFFQIPASIGVALIFSNATTKGLEYARNSLGSGSAMIGTLQMIASSIAIPIVSYFYSSNNTIIPIAICQLICIVLSFMALFYVRIIEKNYVEV